MSRIPQSNEVRPVLAAAAIFLCTGVCIAALFLKMGPDHFTATYWIDGMALTSPLVFLCACFLVFFRPNLGYVLGGIAGMAALPWFVLTESSPIPSIWMSLNGPDEYAAMNLPFVILKILSVALIATATACSLLRLLPLRLVVWNSPLRHRTWPAIAVAVLVLAGWMYHSAKPWLLPTIVDGYYPDLRILHVEKHGLQFHETGVFVMRNRRFWVSRNDRRLFQYRFQSRHTDGAVPPIIHEGANILVHSTTLRNLRTAPPISLRSWNAEGWYVAVDSSPLLAFTSEYGTNPPQEIKDMFEQITKLPGTERPVAIQDVCLGFCYDPVAGLGFWYSNQRCYELPDGTTRCL